MQKLVTAKARPISDLYQQQAVTAAARSTVLGAERDVELSKIALIQTLQLDPRFDGLATDFRFRQIIADLTSKVAMLRRQTDQPTKMVSNGGIISP